VYIPPKSYVLNLADTSLSFFDAFLVPSLADNAHREDILLIGPRHPVRPVDLACWFLHSDRSTNAFPWGPASPGTDLILRCPVPDEELDALDSGAIPYIGFTVQPDRTRPRTVVRATRPRSSETRRHYVSVHATIHGQVDRLPEWIEYHRMLGVEHFYIYDHDSVEAGYPPLRSYVESGVVSYVWWPLPGGRNEQSSFVKRVAMNHCLYKYGRYNEWIAYFDIDEFCQPLGYTDIPAFLEQFADLEEYPGGIHCRSWLFGGPQATGEAPPARGKLLLERCTHRAESPCHNRKNLFVSTRRVAVRTGSSFLVLGTRTREAPPDQARFARCVLDQKGRSEDTQWVPDGSLQAYLPILRNRVTKARRDADASTGSPRRHMVVEAHDAGFFSNFNKVVNQIAHTYTTGEFTSVAVNWPSGYFPYGSGRGNAWDDYFDPLPVDPSAEECWVTAEYAWAGMTSAATQRMYQSGSEWRAQYHDAYQRNIRIKPYILEKTEKIHSAHIASHYCIGVHYRLPTFKDDERPVPSLPLDTYIEHVHRLAPPDTESRVFLADPMKLGEDVLVDVLLLSRCNTVLHGCSNVVTAAAYINPDLRLVECAHPLFCEFTYPVLAPGCRIEVGADGAPLLRNKKGSARGNEINQMIWQLCDGSRTVPQISRDLSEVYGRPWGLVASDVDAIVLRLWKGGFLLLDSHYVE